MKTKLLNCYSCDFTCPGKSVVFVEVVAPTFGKAASIAIVHLNTPDFANYELSCIRLVRPVVVESLE